MSEPSSGPAAITLLTRLSKVVHRRTPEALLGMRWRHFIVLSYLAERDGVAQQELGEILHMDANNLVLLLNELEDLGLVERRRAPEDRRRHIVEITDAGQVAFETAEQAREAIEDSVLSALTPQERVTLRRLLSKALEG